VSYLFIAIIWINHNHLTRFVDRPTLRLIWINFAHLFMVSFLPFATAWVARTRLASSPVAFYAGLFVCIDIAYSVFEREVLAHADATPGMRAHATYRQTPITRCPCDFHDRYAGCIHRAAHRLRSDMRRLDSSPTARCV
jgi:uncharacterized membrane protein